MGTNADTIRQGYEAFARQDIPAVLALFDPEITWTIPEGAEQDLGGTWKTPEGVGEFFGKLPTVFSEIQVMPEEFLEDRDRVVVLGRTRARAQETGKGYETSFVHVWTVREGKAVSMVEHFDTALVNRVFEA